MSEYSTLTPEARLLLEARASSERIKHFHDRLEEAFVENVKLMDELRDARGALTSLCEAVEGILKVGGLNIRHYETLRAAHSHAVMYT